MSLENKEDKIIDYWMKLLPELNYDKKRLENHFSSFLGLKLSEALAQYCVYGENTPLPIITDSKDDFKRNDRLFESFFLKIINKYITNLRICIARSSILFKDNIIEDSLYDFLYKSLFKQGYRLLIHEMNFLKESNFLNGETEEEMFEYYNKLISSDNFVNHLRNVYPEFIESLELKAEQIIYFVKEMITNTENNRNYLKDTFEIEIENSLENIEFTGSDSHNENKSVCVLIFLSGKIVYKPRALIVESNFQKFIHFIDSEYPKDKLYVMRIYTDKNCGWTEYINSDKCNSLSEKNSFYGRIGKLLAIFYILNGVDFHYENVIFKGDQPVVIDLESLFNTQVLNANEEDNQIIVKAKTVLMNSVLSIGLLPTKMKINEETVVQIGALDPQKPYKVHVDKLENIGKANIKIVKEEIEIYSSSSNYNVSEGWESKKFKERVKEGFEEMYKWCLKNKRLLKKQVIEIFYGSQVRIIIKPTMIYSQLLSISEHPDFFTNPLHRKVVLSRLGLISHSELITHIEIDSLIKGDIPYFYTYLSSTNLYSGSSKKNLINNVLVQSPIANFRTKINTLSREDLDFQLRLIEKSFFERNTENEITPLINSEYSLKIYDREQYKKLIFLISDLLQKQKISNDDNEVIWIDSSVTNMDVNDWTPDIISFDLYNGLSGIALFYLNLCKVHPKKENVKLLKSIIEMLIKYIEYIVENKVVVKTGMMVGLSGILLAIFEYDLLYPNKKIEAFLENHIEYLSNMISQNESIDFVSGNVGLLTFMNKVIKKTNNQTIKNKCYHVAEQAYDNIKETLEKHDKQDETTVNYSGFSHGISGLTYSLYTYYNITANDDVYKVFKHCLKFQRDNFWLDSELDWKVTSLDKELSYGWCHGSPGILVEKIHLKKLGYYDEKLDKEISYALNNLLKNLGSNTSMCHGDLGNLLILQEYVFFSEDKKVKEKLEKMKNTMFEYLEDILINDKQVTCTNFYGLMLGLSGVGDYLLKIQDLDKKIEWVDYLW